MNKINDILKNHHSEILFNDKQIKNNTHLIKEEIWSIIEQDSPKNSRKLFFIKTSKIPDHKLLQFKKEALAKDNFCKVFYGKCKFYNINLDKK